VGEAHPMAVRSNALVCGRLTAGIAGSNLAESMVFVCFGLRR